MNRVVPLMDKYEAARLLGVSSGTVMNREWRRRVGLEAIRIGGMLRFKPDDIAALQERGRERCCLSALVAHKLTRVGIVVAQ